MCKRNTQFSKDSVLNCIFWHFVNICSHFVVKSIKEFQQKQINKQNSIFVSLYKWRTNRIADEPYLK